MCHRVGVSSFGGAGATVKGWPGSPEEEPKAGGCCQMRSAVGDCRMGLVVQNWKLLTKVD